MDYGKLLEELINQEKELVLDCFSNDDAYRLGTCIYELAKDRNLPVAIEITKNTQMIYHVSLEGTASDNDEWLRRKANLVTRTGMSSYRINIELRIEGKSFEDRFEIGLEDYAAAGGCFPVKVKGTGLVGTVAVSGLEMGEDHALVIEGIKKYLSEKE